MTTELEVAADFIRETVATERHTDPMGHIRFAEALARHHERQRTKRLVGAVGGGCLVAVSAFATTLALQPKELTYRVDNAAQIQTVGSYVSAPPQKPLGLSFSEGSRVELQPLARGRVAQTSRHGATVVIENGRATAAIVHREKTDWRILAGPFVVGVTGTNFEVGFDVTSQMFELKMHSGSVKVTGPGISTPIEVRGDQRLVLSAKGGEQPAKEVQASKEAATQPECPAPVAEGASAHCYDASAATPGQAPPRRSAAAAAEAESFAQLSTRGQHQRIVELAEKQGFDKSVATAGRADLMALGNAARFAGRANLATLAYRSLRDRFPRTSDAAAAAFFLGRLHETSSPAQGISWYERYVAEAPSGVWVAEALGRRMAILNESRPGPTAKAAAKEYLDRFPSGPYAGFARKILSP